MSTEELLKDCEKISLEPDDVVLYTSVDALTKDMAMIIWKQLNKSFPRNKVLIIDKAGTLDFVRPEEVPA